MLLSPFRVCRCPDEALQYKLLQFTGMAGVSVSYTHLFSPSSKFTVTPSFYGRVLSGSGNYLFAIINMVGGTIPGRYMPPQIPFTGINLSLIHIYTLPGTMMWAL